MTTSPYFNHYNADNEQSLIDGLVIESIQQKGVDVVYLERNAENLGHLLKEDPGDNFSETDTIEMYPTFVDGFEGGDEIFTRYGLDLKQTGTFVVSKTRFAEVFEFAEPREGDLIFLPVTKAILEIKHVSPNSPFFEAGKQYVWEVKVETFLYSHEDITVDDETAADAVDEMTVSEFGETGYDINDDKFADNDEIATEADSEITEDSDNPFGIL